MKPEIYHTLDKLGIDYTSLEHSPNGGRHDDSTKVKRYTMQESVFGKQTKRIFSTSTFGEQKIISEKHR